MHCSLHEAQGIMVSGKIISGKIISGKEITLQPIEH
jgi:hypothetical protein